ncbi:MAG TPA: hypothetical protein VGW38_18925 [Chloroflexota bacterium]|nr:hypothetical protein [Chloroflexota bacterium]
MARDDDHLRLNRYDVRLRAGAATREPHDVTNHFVDNSEESEQVPEWLTRVREEWAAGPIVQPPTWVSARAKRLFQMRRLEQQATHEPSFVERIRATLVFDSRQRDLLAALPGMRSGALLRGDATGTTSSWQILYRGADVDVDVLIRPSGDSRAHTILGQALAQSGTPIKSGQVEVLRTDPGNEHKSTVMLTELLPTGEFVLPHLSRGRYDLLLRLDAREIHVPDIEL